MVKWTTLIHLGSWDSLDVYNVSTRERYGTKKKPKPRKPK